MMGNNVGKLALYPGSFDPVTLGHLDIIKRASAIFPEFHVAVLDNPDKATMFTPDERVAMVRQVLAPDANVTVSNFHGLLVDYARQLGADVIVRGLRAITDFEYEFQMAHMNRTLAPEIDTVYMMTSEGYSYISSRLVKEIAGFDGDISGMVPPAILPLIRQRIKGE